MPPVPASPVSNFPTWTPTVGRAPAEAVIQQAMALLGNQIGILTGAIDKNTAQLSGSGGRAAAGGGAAATTASGASNMLSAPLALLAGKVAAVVGPLAIFSSMLQSHTSGFEVFLTTGKMIGVVLGGLLMPAFVALSGATFALAMLLDGTITPGLESFFAAEIKNASAAFNLFDTALGELSKSLKALGLETVNTGKIMAILGGTLAPILESLKKIGIEPRDIMKGVGGALFNLGGQGEQPAGGAGGRAVAGALGALKAMDLEKAPAPAAGGREERKGFMADAINGMRMAALAMQQSLGAPAAFTSGEEVSKQATLAGFNVNPFEAKILEIQQKQLDAMLQVLGKMGDGIKPAIGG